MGTSSDPTYLLKRNFIRDRWLVSAEVAAQAFWVPADSYSLGAPGCPHSPLSVTVRQPLAFRDSQAGRGRYKKGEWYDSMTGTSMKGYRGTWGGQRKGT